ncbi:hypothetical protein [Massilia cavernae]|uniref:hypothetical protein n=1 Tax=Massilia cavernae TaxID=2320864 RepID=UPI0011C3EA96|nr:hypothetical protein [Massilia cavernae]
MFEHYGMLHGCGLNRTTFGNFIDHDRVPGGQEEKSVRMNLPPLPSAIGHVRPLDYITPIGATNMSPSSPAKKRQNIEPGAPRKNSPLDLPYPVASPKFELLRAAILAFQFYGIFSFCDDCMTCPFRVRRPNGKMFRFSLATSPEKNEGDLPVK